MPRVTCGDQCVDLQTDPKNCGACGVACSDACVMGACCGDGKKNGSEQCDKGDLGGATCAQAAAPGWTGTPGCTSACKFDGKTCTTPPTMWNDFSNASNWSTFDVTSVSGGARGFNGTLFDGRYVYFVPQYNGGYDGIVARYDTQGGFGAGGSWAVFDINSIYGGARGYQGAAFDGRYVYFVPYYDGGNYHGRVARYDTQGAFGTASSWSVFDMSTLFPSARGYHGAIFDGRYVYFVPYSNGGYFGLVVRYDTQGGFGFSGSWSAFDLVTIHPNARGFLGGTFDGRYVYFTPNLGNTSGLVVRYDTTMPFGAMGAWSTFDMTTVTGPAKGYYGGSFDGRYVYFAPYYNGGYSGLVARYDTQGMFGAMASWSMFDLTTINGSARGYVSTVFDGRYVYFIPYYNGGHFGIVARFDSQGMFGAFASWSTFDTTNVNGNARGYLGAAFDGRYLYLSPYYNGSAYSGLVTRLDAKTVSWLPLFWQNAQY